MIPLSVFPFPSAPCHKRVVSYPIIAFCCRSFNLSSRQAMQKEAGQLSGPLRSRYSFSAGLGLCLFGLASGFAAELRQRRACCGAAGFTTGFGDGSSFRGKRMIFFGHFWAHIPQPLHLSGPRATPSTTWIASNLQVRSHTYRRRYSWWCQKLVNDSTLILVGAHNDRLARAAGVDHDDLLGADVGAEHHQLSTPMSLSTFATPSTMWMASNSDLGLIAQTDAGEGAGLGAAVQGVTAAQVWMPL